ncbi:MAG: cysteine desulfurase-like protein [Aggregatilineales bacterium]
MTIDVEKIRAQFPALHQPVAGKSTLPVFFDNPAGTQVSKSVIDAVSHYYTTMNANSGGTFATSQRTDTMTQNARELMADFLNAPNSQEIAFGPNMTTLNFSLSRALAKTLNAGDEIVLTRMDHDANVSPWLLIARDHDLIVRWVDINTEDCTLDMNTLEAALTDKTKIVATVHASNAVGSINPVKQIAEMAHAAGAYHVVDAVQSAPHLPIDVQAIGCDFLLCSAYKFFGPHIGILWGKYELLASLPVYKVRPSKDKPPHRWEVGTGSYETIAGVGAAIEYFATIGEQYGEAYQSQFQQLTERKLHLKTAMAVLGDYERELASHLLEVLGNLNSAKIYGITDQTRLEDRVPTVVFTIEGHTPDEIAAHLASQDIYVWSGDYYAVEIMDRLNHSENGMVRVGLAHYNTHAEIDRLEAALKQLA